MDDNFKENDFLEKEIDTEVFSNSVTQDHNH